MRVCDVIRKHHDDIVEEWASEVRKLPSARAVPRPALVDHIPELLTDIGSWLRGTEANARAKHDTTAIQHAFDRLSKRFDLREVVDEYRILRNIVQARVLSEGSADLFDLGRFHSALDEAIAVAVHHYAERRDAEVREKAVRFRLALAASRLGVWEWRPAERSVVCDETVRAMLGLGDAERVPWDAFLSAVHIDDRLRFVQTLQRCLAKDADFAIELRAIVGTTEKWLRAVGSVVERNDAGQAVRAVATAADITDEKRTADGEQASKRELEAVAQLGDEMIRAHSLDELLPRLLRIFVRSCPGVDTATILLCEGDTLHVKAMTGLEGPNRWGYEIPVGKGFAGTVAATRRPMLLHDAAHSDLVISRWVREHGIRAFYGVPLISGEKLVGVAHIASRALSDFPENAKSLFGLIAERAASAIALRSLHDQLARQKAELEAVVTSLPDGLFVMEGDCIRYVNPAGAQILGARDPRDMYGPLAELHRRVHPRDPMTGQTISMMNVPFARAARGERAIEHMVLRRIEDGRDVHVRFADAPIVVGGRVLGAVSICSDLTRLVELERQRDAFMHAIVHDLRNPLSSIVAVTQLVMRKIERDGGDAWVSDRLRKVEANALMLSRLIDDLLDIVLASTGHLNLHRTRVRVMELLEEQALSWEATTKRHSIRVRSCDAEALADRGRIVQVLDNLLSNAIKYSPQGGDIDVECERRDGHVCILVRDHGIGIPPDEQRRIFEPYARVNGYDRTPGHGLGLFMASAIVRQHGGQIGVRSEPGKGAEFWFTLPLAESAEERPPSSMH